MSVNETVWKYPANVLATCGVLTSLIPANVSGEDFATGIRPAGAVGSAAGGRSLHPLLDGGLVDVLCGNALVHSVDQQCHGARRCWAPDVFKLGAGCEQRGGDCDHLGISRHRRVQARLQNRRRFAVFGTSPIGQHVARIAERGAHIDLGVSVRESSMCSGGAQYLGLVPQIDLVIERKCQRSGPASVPVTDRAVCWQVAVDGSVYSFASHTSSAKRTSQMLLERSPIASKTAQTRLEDVYGLTADSS